MRTLFVKPALLLLVAASTGSIAQDSCVDLAKTIVFNTNRTFSLDEQRAISKADLCVEQYKSNKTAKALQIEASYKFFSGGVAGSENQVQEEQNKQCEGKFGDYWSRSIKTSDARTASAESLAVVGTCLQLRSKGITPSMTVSNDGREFSLTLDWASSPPTDLVLAHVGPRTFQGFACSAQQDGKLKPVTNQNWAPVRLKSGESFTLACERPAKVTKRDGEDYSCYQEQLLSVATNGPPATLKLPQVCSNSIPGKRAQDIERRLKDAETTIASIDSRLGTSEAERARQAADTLLKLDNANRRIDGADARFRWKTGNNGSVSCQAYCTGTQWEGYKGECVSAVIGASVLESCVKPNYGGPVHCLCFAR